MQDGTGHKQEIGKENTASQHTDSAQKEFSNDIFPAGFHPHKAGLENLDRQGYEMHCGHSPERNLIAFPFFSAVLISLVHHPPRSSASTSYLSGGLSGGLHVQECWTSHRERRTP